MIINSIQLKSSPLETAGNAVKKNDSGKKETLVVKFTKDRNADLRFFKFAYNKFRLCMHFTTKLLSKELDCGGLRF